MGIAPHIRRLRSFVGHELLLFPSAAVLPIDAEGRVLLAWAAGTRDGWGTVGGAIDPGESPAEAAIREAREEIGVEVRLERLLDVLGGPEYEVTYPNGDRTAYVTAVYEARVVAGDPAPADGELSKVAWFALSELPGSPPQPLHPRTPYRHWIPAAGRLTEARKRAGNQGAPVNHTLSSGQRALVAVGVSTVWTAPDAPRACDAPAIAGTPRLPDWVSGMSREQRKGLSGRTLTQVLFGDTVLVEEAADGWVRIVAIEQAAPHLDPRGYPGWLPAPHIVPDDRGEQPAGRHYVVDAMFSTLHEGPEAVSPAVDVVLGTRLTAAGQAQGGYVPVAARDRPAPLWANLAHLAPASGQPATARDVLEVARRFEGVPYIWGGISPYGLDCSGLVYLAHRRLNAVVPRDACDQAEASCPVEPGEQAPGQLCFFRDGSAPVDHVGLIDEPGRLLHASGGAGQVQREPLEGDLARRLAAIHRTLP